MAMATVSLTEAIIQPPEAFPVLKITQNRSGNMTPHPPTVQKFGKSRLRLDPQRALEPARKKLTSLEAQRIMAVINETVRRLEIVNILPTIVEDTQPYQISFGAELIQLLENHRVILQSFNELKEAAEKFVRKTEDDSSTEDESEASQHQVEEAVRNLNLVAREMHSSCKNILRALYLDPTAMSVMLKAAYSPSVGSKDMKLNIIELRDILMAMFLTTPDEEADRNNYLRNIAEQERVNSAMVVKLEAELQAAIADRDEEIKKKNDVIRHLQTSLHSIQKYSEEHINRLKTDADKQEAADSKNSEQKQDKLTQEITKSKTEFQQLIEDHRESEQQMRRKKYKLETEVENLIQKYDMDMGEKQDEYEDIDAKYTEEKKQLNELEEKFKVLEEEYNQILNERRLAKERREAQERELQTEVKAALVIQAFWRSFKVRKALKSKKKKGGKKKK